MPVLPDDPVPPVSVNARRERARELLGPRAGVLQPQAVTARWSLSLHVPGLPRYEVAQGFQPTVVRLEGRSSAEVRWSIDQAEGWQGPPAAWFAWAA